MEFQFSYVGPYWMTVEERIEQMYDRELDDVVQVNK